MLDELPADEALIEATKYFRHFAACRQLYLDDKVK